jgi:hypothetical protein
MFSAGFGQLWLPPAVFLHNFRAASFQAEPTKCRELALSSRLQHPNPQPRHLKVEDSWSTLAWLLAYKSNPTELEAYVLVAFVRGSIESGRCRTLRAVRTCRVFDPLAFPTCRVSSWGHRRPGGLPQQTTGCGRTLPLIDH